ncbi:MAG: hypothetical protein ABJL55_18725 [Roseibium sp.]
MVLFRAVFCAFYFVFLTCSSAFGETWRIASLEWPPYSGSKLAGSGTAVEALRSILKDQQITLVVDFMPWPRAKTVAATEDYVGYFPAWPEEVLSGFEPSLPITTSQIGIIQHKNKQIAWTDLRDLFDNHKVGFVTSYVYPQAIQDLISEVYGQNSGEENEHDLARTLAAGRVDVAVTDPNVMMFVANELSLEGIEPNSRVLHQHPLVLAVAKKGNYQERIRVLNSAITAK